MVCWEPDNTEESATWRAEWLFIVLAFEITLVIIAGLEMQRIQSIPLPPPPAGAVRTSSPAGYFYEDHHER